MIYKEVTLEKAQGDDLLNFIASDETPDGHGDIVRADGWDLKRYRKNPIVLFGHDHTLPVGYSPKTAIEGKSLKSAIKLAKPGTSEFIDTLRSLIEQNIVRAVSVGFKTTKPPVPIRDPDDHIMGFEFNGTELLEISIVSVPANPNSLQSAKSLGVSERSMARLFAPDALVQSAKRQRQILLATLGASSKSR